MRRAFALMFPLLLMASVCFADRPIFLVTPAGLYQSVVGADGKPGPWVPIAADVIVQGFPTGGPNTPIPPDPPVSDKIVEQIQTISKLVLKDKDEATAVAAIVDSIAKLNLSPADFKQALEMSAPIADTSLGSGGRIVAWVKQALAITSDPAKLKAGVSLAFGVAQTTLDAVQAAAADPASVATGEALNFAKLIEILQLILTLLKNLGIGV